MAPAHLFDSVKLSTTGIIEVYLDPDMGDIDIIKACLLRRGRPTVSCWTRSTVAWHDRGLHFCLP